MKKIVSVLTLIMLLSGIVMATPPKSAEIKIKTSAKCGMCKKRIEKDLGDSKGIINSNLDLKDKVITVTYNPKKTSPEKIKGIISKTGYDADEVMADATAHDNLPGCCQKNSKME